MSFRRAYIHTPTSKAEAEALDEVIRVLKSVFERGREADRKDIVALYTMFKPGKPNERKFVKIKQII